MQRWATIVIGAFIIAITGGLLWKGGRGPVAPPTTSLTSDAGEPVVIAPTKGPDASGASDLVAARLLDRDAGPTLALEGAEQAPSSMLPTGTPKMVHFGVILVQYRGAQAVPSSARSRDEAAALARALAEGAKTDFKGQVAKGDPGSMEDAGRIPRGVLEPTTEFTLFTLPPGGVSDPLDTPRGFWIVRRID